MRALMVGYNEGALAALDAHPDEFEVWVLEEPDLWRNKGLQKKADAHPVLAETVFAPYQQSTGYREALAGLPRFDAVAAGLEYAVPAAADLAERLDLPGAGSQAASILRNKLRLREATAAAGMRCPEFREVASAAEVSAFHSAGPCVVKPAERQASLGVTLLGPGDDPERAWEAALGADEGVQLAERDMRWQYMAERRLEGPEYSTEVLVFEGETRFLNVTRKECFPGSRPVEAGHLLPVDSGSDRWERAVADLVAAVGFSSGILHAEWIDTDPGPTLVEVAGRPPGDFIVDLIDRAWGVDLHRLWLRMLAGEDIAAPRSPRGGAAIRFLRSEPGTIAAVEGAETVAERDEVWKADVTKKPGDRVADVQSSWDRVGCVATVGADAETARALAVEAASHITVTVEGAQQ
ncbi:ATP-grasp domain-containing protein [Glycomyces xiaoerkulensis]|uniref:ATP-grasp domain-containing protein n=1 Tax=Glycomyces xiaoerkulensis TaxID=2038139 RepID=UPI000C25F950|nr:ATP-grasp domain-containing protein [Glycomyces xiaoerkulensis]